MLINTSAGFQLQMESANAGQTASARKALSAIEISAKAWGEWLTKITAHELNCSDDNTTPRRNSHPSTLLASKCL
jgi:hypothetical protein